MPKGFMDDGRPIMTKEEFVEQFKFDLEMRENKRKQEINKKAIEQFNKDNDNEMKKLNKHVKKSATTTGKKDDKTEIAEKFADMFDTQGYDVTIDKATVTIKNRNATYELKIVKKNEPYETSDYDGTKDAMKNKLIQIALEMQYSGFVVEMVDKTGLVGINDGTTYYTAKFTKKKA